MTQKAPYFNEEMDGVDMSNEKTNDNGQMS